MEAFSPKPSSSASKVHLAWPSARLPREQFFVDLRRIVQHQVLGEVYTASFRTSFSRLLSQTKGHRSQSAVYRKIDDATFQTDRERVCVRRTFAIYRGAAWINLVSLNLQLNPLHTRQGIFFMGLSKLHTQALVLTNKGVYVHPS